MSENDFDWGDQAGSAGEAYQEFLVPGMFTPFAESLLDDAGVGPGMRVLDVACGTGIVSRLAARRVAPDGSVTGVDITEPMLAVARAFPPEEGAATIEYVEGDATSLPAEDGSVDVVTCHHGLQFFPEKAAAMAEARRTLGDGGVAAVGCWAPGAPTLVALIDALGRHLGEETAAGMKVPFSLGNVDAMRAVFEEAGFTDIDAHETTLDATFSDQARFAPRILAAGPLAGIFAEAPEDVRAAITAEVAESLEPYATDDGGVRAPMTSVVVIARG